MNNDYRIKYPRRIILRKSLVLIGKILIRLLTKFEIIGEENFPKEGPYIVAGNHVAALETLLMVLYTPENVEILGGSDIPLDPNLKAFANIYGYIPIFRGSIDQNGLKTALYVLKQNGVIGIFPGGGIWDDQSKQAKIGVSWLSVKSGAPVIPIGFIGMKDALSKALSFKRPVIAMKIGEIIKPEEFFSVDQSYKQSLLMGANFIMGKILQLLPDSETYQAKNSQQNPGVLSIYIMDKSLETIESVKTNGIAEVSFLLNHPVLMDVFARNLKLPMKVLVVRDRPISLKDFVDACNTILAYLKENPGFLIYRLGMETGLATQNGLVNLVDEYSCYEYENFEIIIKQGVAILNKD